MTLRADTDLRVLETFISFISLGGSRVNYMCYLRLLFVTLQQQIYPRYLVMEPNKIKSSLNGLLSRGTVQCDLVEL